MPQIPPDPDPDDRPSIQEIPMEFPEPGVLAYDDDGGSDDDAPPAGLIGVRTIEG